MSAARRLAAFGVVGLLLGCSPSDDARITAVEAKRLSGGTMQITWSGGPADIYRAGSPDEPLAKMERLTAADADHVFDAALPAEGRPYFFVAAEGSRHGLFVAERLLPLEGGRNFRDLGGYRTVDGKHVRWGKIYRSGAMAGLTDRDYRTLSSLGIAVVCDFRTDEERASEPTQWRATPPADYVSWPGEPQLSALRQAFAAGKPSAQTMRAAMLKLYEDLPFIYAQRYAAMFARLAKGEMPLAFHCTAGKDRTGLAAALILSALRVPRETIFADYALSDVSMDLRAELTRQKIFASLPDDVLEQLFKSDPAYLSAAFARMDADSGSVEGYLHKVLAVRDEDIKAIRAALLE